MKFNRIVAGHYATPDGRYAAISDGRTYANEEQRAYGEANEEWAATFSPGGGLREDHQIGETLDWFDTKREAQEACRKHAEKENRV